MRFLDSNNEWTPEFLAYLEKSARMSIKLTLTKDPVRITDSKVGGKPWLPQEISIPRDADGNDYLFIAQLNWAQMPRLDGFPEKGMTSFFVKADDTFGLLDGAYHVFHFANVPDIDEIDPYLPENLDLYSPILGGPYKLSGKLEKQLVPYKDRQAENYQLPTDQDEVATSKYWDLTDSSGSRIGGYPYFTQEDPRSEDMELLLQLDMEGDHREYYVSWGDSGVANFFIRREDLLRLDFSKVAYTWDCL